MRKVKSAIAIAFIATLGFSTIASADCVTVAATPWTNNEASSLANCPDKNWTTDPVKWWVETCEKQITDETGQPNIITVTRNKRAGTCCVWGGAVRSCWYDAATKRVQLK